MLTRSRFCRVIDQLKQDEGLELTPYQDTEHVWTVGYGHNMNQPITMEAADHILRDDLARSLMDLDLNRPWWIYLKEDAQLAIANMQFNLGWPRLRTFKKMWAALEKNDYQTAAAEMRDSKWYRQVGARAERLAVMMERSAVPTTTI